VAVLDEHLDGRSRTSGGKGISLALLHPLKGRSLQDSGPIHLCETRLVPTAPPPTTINLLPEVHDPAMQRSAQERRIVPSSVLAVPTKAERQDCRAIEA